MRLRETAPVTCVAAWALNFDLCDESMMSFLHRVDG
jgi:hypothetical protein